MKKRNLMSLWKGLMSLCMDWLTCLFAIFFCFLFVWQFSWVVCQRMFAVFSFILEDCVLFVSVCHLTSPAKMHFFKYPIFVLTPALSFSSSPPSSKPAEGSVCQSRHSCFIGGETNYHRPQKLSTPASSLKSPLPLTFSVRDWGVRYLTDDQEYWELHRTL